MSNVSRSALVLCLCLAAAACTTTTPGVAPALAGEATIDGTIASIDTDPWAYDGNAVVQVDGPVQGRVAVQLPARWNLCKAAPVDVAALKVGMRVHAVGTMDAERRLVVCQQATHRLVPAS